MSNGEPSSEYAGIAAEFAKAKARREREESRGLRDPSGDGEDNRRGIRFKAIHGLLIAFLAWIL